LIDIYFAIGACTCFTDYGCSFSPRCKRCRHHGNSYRCTDAEGRHPLDLNGICLRRVLGVPVTVRVRQQCHVCMRQLTARRICVYMHIQVGGGDGKCIVQLTYSCDFLDAFIAGLRCRKVAVDLENTCHSRFGSRQAVAATTLSAWRMWYVMRHRHYNPAPLESKSVTFCAPRVGVPSIVLPDHSRRFRGLLLETRFSAHAGLWCITRI